MKILFIMFQGAGTNSAETWDTPSCFGDELRKLGRVWTYQHKLNNVFGYVEKWAKDWPKSLSFDLGYLDIGRHVRDEVYAKIPAKYKNPAKYVHVPVAWSAGGYLAMAYSNIIPMSKACILLDPVLINPKSIADRIKFFEQEKGVGPVSDEELKLMLRMLRRDPDKKLAYKIIATGFYLMTCWARDHLSCRLKVPTMYVSTIEKKDDDTLGSLSNKARLREVKFLSKNNPKKMFRALMLDNASHCVFYKVHQTKLIVSEITEFLSDE